MINYNMIDDVTVHGQSANANPKTKRNALVFKKG